MPNPILQALNGARTVTPAGINNLRNISRMLRGVQNPQAALQQMFPQYGQVMQLVQQHGGDAKAAFYAEAEKQGINPDDILNAINGQ